MIVGRTELGLGQWYPGESINAPSTCGPNPCDFFDYLWVSDDCSTWLACAGQPAVTASNVLAQGAATITGGAASVVGSAVAGATGNISTDLLLVGGIVAAILVFLVIEKF